MKDIAIFGAGGFGREVLGLINDINNIKKIWNIIGFFDDGIERGKIINGYEVLGGLDELELWKKQINIAISIGNPIVKKKIVETIQNKNVIYPTLIHPNVVIGDNNFVEIGRGCIICSSNIITTNIKIKDFVILNLACTIGHDTIINDYAAFMPSVNISGEVDIGRCVYCGTNATIINQIKIGENTIIGAGAVVTKDLPSDCTAVGMPARPIKFHKNNI